MLLEIAQRDITVSGMPIPLCLQIILYWHKLEKCLYEAYWDQATAFSTQYKSCIITAEQSRIAYS